jgi:SAM-dependent methyltransferase
VNQRDDWSQHWEDFADAASRNPAQAYRRRLALGLLEADGPPRRLLDIGSGQGDFLAAARRRWPRAVLAGLEVSEVGIAQAHAKVPDARLELRDLTTDARPSPQLTGWGTHALCSEVLEHVDDPIRLLAQARSYLAPRALVVITVPGGPMSAFDRHIGHRQHFTPASLTEVVRGAGLDVDWAAGAGFPFFNLYRRVVIARGERLVDDVATSERGAKPPLAARAAMAAFGPLFRANLTRSRWGTQIVAVARTRAEVGGGSREQAASTAVGDRRARY